MNKKIAIIGMLGICMIATFIFSIATWCFAGSNSYYYFDDLQISEKYSYGDSFTVPNCKMHYDNEEFNTTFKVVFPDGSESFDKNITLTQKGNYKLIYEGFDYINGNTQLKVIDFFAASKLYEIVGLNESSNPVYKQTEYNGAYGIVANIMNGNTLKFNNSINLSKLTSGEGIIEFFHVPINVGYLDGFFNITLTDAYDSNNYLSILVRKYNEDSGDGWYNAYVSVSFNGGDEVGLRFNNNKNNDASSVYYNGAWYQLDRNNDLGTCVNYSMIGTPRYDVPLGGQTLKFSYDHAEKKIYANGILVCDLDDPLFYPNTFGGFTNDEVFLSFSGFNYSQSTVNPIIVNVAQMDISKNILSDDVAPEIVVDTSQYDGQILGIKKHEFKLFNAVANDKIDGDCKVIKQVFRNYYSSKVFVPVNNDSFIPTRDGKYYIEYSTFDNSGNSSKKVIEVNIVEKSQALDFSVQGELNTNIVAGAESKLCDGVSLTGDQYGNSIKLEAVIRNVDNNSEFLLDDNFKFLPMQSGEYELTISVSDYVETVKKSFTVTVQQPNAPVFIGEPQLEKYYIKGAKYYIPVFNALNINASGYSNANTDVYVKQDNGEYQKINGSFVVTASETVKFKFVANESIYYSSEIQAIDVNYNSKIDLAKYFYGEVTSETTKDYVKYSTENLVNGSSRFDFINSVQSENLYLSIGFNKVVNEFEKFNIYITDAYDKTNTIKLTFSSYNDSTCLTVNDNNRIVLSKNYLLSNVLYGLTYNNSNKTLNADGDALIDIKYNSEGKLFNGFSKFDVFLSFEFLGVNGIASVNIYELNGQTFNNQNNILAPEFTHEVCVGEYGIGEIFKLSKIIVDDVLDPYIELVDFYVKTPSGQFAYSVDGVKLDASADYTKDYYIQAKEYGAYYIYMDARNSKGNRSFLPVSEEVRIVDMVAPGIVLDSKLPQIVEVGKEITIPSVTLSDDNSSVQDIKFYVILKSFDGTVKLLKESKFKAESKGKYEVMFVAYDENSNMTVLTVELNVQ